MPSRPGLNNRVRCVKLLVADLVSARDSTMVYDGVPVTLHNTAADPNRFTLHVDGHGLGWTPATETDPRLAKMILMVTTFDKKGKELKQVAKRITVAASRDVAPTGRLERSVDLLYAVEPDPKAVRARFRGACRRLRPDRHGRYPAGRSRCG